MKIPCKVRTLAMCSYAHDKLLINQEEDITTSPNVKVNGTINLKKILHGIIKKKQHRNFSKHTMIKMFIFYVAEKVFPPFKCRILDSFFCFICCNVIIFQKIIQDLRWLL